jgi:hypothetical protein
VSSSQAQTTDALAALRRLLWHPANYSSVLHHAAPHEIIRPLIDTLARAA